MLDLSNPLCYHRKILSSLLHSKNITNSYFIINLLEHLYLSFLSKKWEIPIEFSWDFLYNIFLSSGTKSDIYIFSILSTKKEKFWLNWRGTFYIINLLELNQTSISFSFYQKLINSDWIGILKKRKNIHLPPHKRTHAALCAVWLLGLADL